MAVAHMWHVVHTVEKSLAFLVVEKAPRASDDLEWPFISDTERWAEMLSPAFQQFLPCASE
jgi:hypothetical protein